MAGEAKIRIKVGSLELDYEGAPAFLADGLQDLLEKMAALSGRVPEVATQNEAPMNSMTSSDVSHSTSTLAAQLESKTGPELAICALAQLVIIQKKPAATRKDILDEMKSASEFYNTVMSSNLTKTLKALVKSKRINKNSTDTYSLSAAEKKSLEVSIAEIG